MGTVNSINESIPDNFEALCIESDSMLNLILYYNS